MVVRFVRRVLGFFGYCPWERTKQDDERTERFVRIEQRAATIEREWRPGDLFVRR